MKEIRSVSFDTSFLLKDDHQVDKIIKKLRRDKIQCYITSTVVSELELLRVNDRIEEKLYNKATSRWHRVGAKIIDFKNRLLSAEFTRECQSSMEEHHGVKPDDIVNDCRIIVIGLKKGIDIFISEDFHFTSKITDNVLKDVTSNACKEYHQMCDEELHSLDTETFLKAYDNGKLDLKVLDSNRQSIKKPGKDLRN